MAIRQCTEIRAFEESWEAVPASLKSHFTDCEATAYREGPAYFKRLASDLPQEHPLKTLFTTLSDDHPMFVFVETYGGKTTLIWFAFTFVHNVVSRPLFRLPTNVPLPGSAPPAVVQLYSYFGGIKSDNEAADGLLPPELLRCRTIPAKHQGETNSNADVHLFLSYGNGDMFGWNEEGHGIFVSHDPPMAKTQSVDQVIAQFLTCLTEKEDVLGYFRSAFENRGT